MLKNKLIVQALTLSLGVLTIFLTSPTNKSGGLFAKQSLTAHLGSPVSFLAMNTPVLSENSMEYRIARRLRNRLIHSKQHTPGTLVLAQAIRERQKLLRKSVSMHFISDDGAIDTVEILSVQSRPLWIKPEFSYSSAHFKLDEDRITTDLEHEPLVTFPKPVDVTVYQTAMSGSVLRADTPAVASSGYEFDEQEAVKAIKESLNVGQSTLILPLTFRHGRILYLADGKERELTQLATGKSNFRGSTTNRIFNVRKGLHEHIHNIIIPDGATFSFNETLGGHVTTSRGWRMAKVIFNGDELRLSPGGGLCQVSTTTYRAAVNAGLPVLDRRSHSLYVSYYKKYGVGIDATIFPGTQDLTFVNDTGNPIIIQTESNDAYDAFVHFYGVPDGRSVALTGPIFAASAPREVQVNGRSVAKNEIVWIQEVRYTDGHQERNLIVSRYKKLPVSLSSEFIVQERGHERIAQL